MHITNQKLRFNIFTVGNLQNIFVEHDLLMIFGIKEKSKMEKTIQCIVSYCYKYTRATYDWFCGPGLHILLQVTEKLHS